jgi:transcriptional regulator with XRE-family HTH domain
MANEYISFGKNVKKHRNLNELTQEQLAVKVGCDARHIGRIETGKGGPSLQVAILIANNLEVGLERLIYGELTNRNDYYAQELIALTEGLTFKEKDMIMEIVIHTIEVIKEHRG